MESLLYWLEEFLDGQLSGACLLLVLAVLCGSGFLVLLRATLRRSLLVPVFVTLGSAVFAVVLAAVRVAEARQQALSISVGEISFGGPSENAGVLAANLSRLILTVRFVSPTVALSALVTLIALWRQPSLRRPLAVLAASLSLLTAGGIYASNEGFTAVWRCVGTENWPACRYELTLETLQALRAAGLAVVVTAVLGWGFTLLWASRNVEERIGARGRAMWGSTVLLLTGVVASAATRAERADASSLVPPDTNQVGKYAIDRRLQEQLPRAEQPCFAVDAPLVTLELGRVSVDGIGVGAPEDLRAELVKKRELREQLTLQPEFTAPVVLAAPRSSKVSELLPWLLAAEAGGYSRIGALLAVPTVELPTRTVGVLEKRRCCVKVWTSSGEGASALARFETWGEMVASVPALRPLTE